MIRVKIGLYGMLTLFFAALVGWSIFRGVPALSIRGFMDFPCYVEYDPQNDCVVPYPARSAGAEEDIQIETFLTSRQAGFYGGGCDHETSSTSLLELSTFCGDFGLQRIDEILTVDGEIIAEGQSMTRVIYAGLDPWVISRFHLKNLGVVADCNDADVPSRMVVTGSYGTETSLAKGILLSTLGLAGLVVSSVRLSRFRAKEARRRRRARSAAKIS